MDLTQIEKRFTRDLYHRYINGDITLTNLRKQLNASEYELKLLFKKLGLKYRTRFLDETTNHRFFDTIDSELKAYLLGFYFADGCVYENKFSVSLTETEIKSVELFRNAISPHRKITTSKGFENKKTGYTSKPMVTLIVTSKHLCETLNKYGMGSNKTTGTTTDLSMVPDIFMIDFIRGYFDGDGTVCVTQGKKRYVDKHGVEKTTKYHNYNWSIISKKKEHLVVIKNFLEDKYGIHSNIISDNRGNFLIEVNRKHDFVTLKSVLYNEKTYYMQRKKDKYFSFDIKEDKPRILKMKNGEVVKTYNTKAEAGQDEGITAQGINVRIKKNIEINGFTWKLEEKA